MPQQLRTDEHRAQRFARTLRKHMTDAEVIMWSRLRDTPFGMRFRRQHPIGPYIADFACPMARLIVEVDGGTHSTAAELAYDQRRDAYLRRRGWRVLRVSNLDVYRNLGGVLDEISLYARARRTASQNAR
jgi:very-short-patch-repair endonuclease